jgi:tellurium resistance protein TerD
LGADGKVPSDECFVFYGNLTDPSNSVEHTGDVRDGESPGDDERILIDLPALPAEVQTVALTATVHDAQVRGQDFGSIAGSTIRLINQDDGEVKLEFGLDQGASGYTSVVFAKLTRKGTTWDLHAVGEPVAGDLGDLARSFGVDVED